MKNSRKKVAAGGSSLTFGIIAIGAVVGFFGVVSSTFLKHSPAGQIATTVDHSSPEIPRFAPDRVLVKFRQPIQAAQVIERVFAKPQDVYVQPDSGRVVQSYAPDYERAATEKTLQQKTITPKVKGAAESITQQGGAVPLRELVNGWKEVSTTDEVDVFALTQALRADAQVEAAEPVYIFKAFAIAPKKLPPLDPESLPYETINDTYYSTQNSWGNSYPDLWGLKNVVTPADWRVADGSGKVVAVIDSGVDYNHEDLATNIWKNDDAVDGIDSDANGYVDDVRGYDFTTCAAFSIFGDCTAAKGRDANPADDNGHGTHVAGTIAAVVNNGKGIAGVCPKCQVMPVKALNPQGAGYVTDLADAIRYAADNGAQVINMSWGGLGYSAMLNAAVDYAHAKGAVLVAAAGNDGAPVELYSPASFANVISVGSVDHNGVRSTFSNWGNLDLVAPGGDSAIGSPISPIVERNILSLRAAGTDMYGDGLSIVGEKYFRSRGTSMAAPYVAGIAALLKAKYPSFTNEQIRASLNQGATDLSFGGSSCAPFTTQTQCQEHAAQYCSWGQCSTVHDQSICTSLPGCSWAADGELCLGDGTCTSAGDVYGGGYDPYTGHGLVSAKNALAIANPLVAHISSPSVLGVYHPGERVSIVGSAQGGGFASYTVSVYPKNDSSKKVQLLTSTTPKSNGVLAEWNTANAIGNYTIELQVKTSTGQAISVQRKALAGLEPGWPFKDAGSVSNTVTADVDTAYPGNEIIGVATGFRGLPLAVFVLHADGTLMPGWPVGLGSEVAYDVNRSGPTVVDVDADGDLEIVVGTSKGSAAARVYVFQHTGQVLPGWPQTVSDSLIAPVVGAQLDSTASRELIGVTKSGSVYVWKSNGQLFSSAWPKALNERVFDPIAVGNLNADAQEEFVITTTTNDLLASRAYVFRGDGTSVNDQWPKTLLDGGANATLGDIDADGIPEILIGTKTHAYLFSTSGQLLPGAWPIGFPDNTNVGKLLLAEVDTANPGPEIVSVSQLGASTAQQVYVSVRDSRGALINVHSSQVLPLAQSGRPTLADLNDDGLSEILFMNEESVHAYTSTGETFSAEWPIDLTPLPDAWLLYQYQAPVVADFNTDGKNELLVANGRDLFMFRLPH